MYNTSNISAFKAVNADFWTYCCINCLHVLPELAAIEEEFAGQPVAVIGVHAAKFPAEQEAANVERALARHAVRHPVVLDPDHRLWEQYAIRSWPTVVVLDPTGKVAWQQAGEVSRHALRAVVAELLAEHAPDLAAPAWRLPAAPAPLPHLAFPGKVAVYPDAMAQMAHGADPFADDARLYASDTGNHRVLELRLRRGADGWPAAEIARVFGDGRPGLQDGALARFREPQGLARQGESLWVADTGNHCVRRIDLASGAVHTVAGTGERGEGALAAGEPRKLALRSPWDVAAAEGDGETALFIAMAGSHQIWVLLPEAGRMGPFVGTGREDHVDGPPEQAALAQPSALALAGNHLFFLDSETSSVRVYQMERRQVGTLVGGGLFDFGDVDGPPEQALLQHPLGLALGERELYVADTFNNKIKRIELQSGAVSTLAGGASGALSEPGGLARAGDFLVVADTNNHRLRAVHRVSGEIRDLPVSW